MRISLYSPVVCAAVRPSQLESVYEYLGLVRAAIYCRISQDRTGAGLGVQRQEVESRELSARLGWSVVEVFARC